METKIFNELNVAITVIDSDGNILEMNEKSKKTFEKYGGPTLIGQNVSGCHKKESIDIMKQLMNENKSNTYTIEKNGIKKLIYQTPWYENKVIMGLVEFSIELPDKMPHFVRT